MIRSVISESSSGSRAVISPPPSTTWVGSAISPRRRIATTAMTQISSARRRTTPRATSSPFSATASSTGASPEQRLLADLARVQAERDVADRGDTEVPRHRAAQRGLRPPAVLGPDRPPQRRVAQCAPAAPVSADAAEREVAGCPSVRVNAHAVDARAAGDGDPPVRCAGSLVLTLVNSVLSNEAFLSWGWRVPFLISILMVAVGAYIRYRVPESPEFEAVKREQNIEAQPLVQVVKSPRNALAIMAIRIGENVFYYAASVFVLSYCVTFLGVDRSVPLNAILIGALLAVVLAPVGGALADRIGARAVMAAGFLLQAVWVFARCLRFSTPASLG